MKVVNGKTDGFLGRDQIYIGRYNPSLNLQPSPLNNPYKITKSCSRERAIELYRQLLWKSIQASRDTNGNVVDHRMIELIQLAKKTDAELVCWCAPEPCHGDVIIKAIEWLKTQDWFINLVENQ